ncbi:MAG: hypothetical protein OXH76_06965 [Boseongicola sp.]|nr:hypothetical protein [Boseongicola sp.]
MAEEHFFGLREAFPDLRGVAIFGHLELGVTDNAIRKRMAWSKREFEIRVCTERTPEAFVQVSGQSEASGPRFEQPESERRPMIMGEAVTEVTNDMQMLDKGSSWDADTKVSDDFFAPRFNACYGISLANLDGEEAVLRTGPVRSRQEMDLEVHDKLEAFAKVSERGVLAFRHQGHFVFQPTTGAN